MGKHEIIRGFEGKLQGKLSRRGFYWRKAANQVAGTGRLMLEEAFDQRGGYVLVRRDFRNVITSRVFRQIPDLAEIGILRTLGCPQRPRDLQAGGPRRPDGAFRLGRR